MGAAGGDVVILLHAVAGDPEAAHQLAVAIERGGAGKEYDAGLVRVGDLASLGAGCGQIGGVHVGKRAGLGVPDAGREESLRGEADGAIGDGGAKRDAGQVARVAGGAGEVDHVAPW